MTLFFNVNDGLEFLSRCRHVKVVGVTASPAPRHSTHLGQDLHPSQTGSGINPGRILVSEKMSYIIGIGLIATTVGRS